ncbi:glutamine synthetase [Thermobispora bispora]|jgi:glutamine synthetase|uniref:glutamine synthetase n=1 Tax=Thermobispora bispora (strain ATCC 19993 / DSM 43833 / CBS 139.67 / JCM 10125 / KCTC 9307 / NBRC 14880 / R51) TaxID=469371 RepID=D6YB91_THEBD|nr:glutamine synthetase family protein [Thermobispora bispora]MBO2475227.1 glutamine synthetase [Actinomycetales bacterium]MDI9580358.1 glutamine synthetase family protein [Thermobispora sp.]ADG88451.1 glutamine synthetase catalytic region [Thermobispora bispora DSM 43833]MBX6167852.1 glutamine synthetase [Thermobispora bispora]QSI48264.1 glutamine synthetase [Thermobispora bispora]
MTNSTTATALDQHRERNADLATLEALEKRIADAGVQYIYYQAITVTGRAVGKVVPADQLRRNAEKGVQMHRTVVADFQATRDGTLLGGGVEAAEITAIPDLDTFTVLPWDPSVGRFFCRMYEPDHRPEVGGQPFEIDVRGNLIRRHEEFTQRTGLELRTGCEPEMTWTGPGLEVSTRPDSSTAYRVEFLERYRPIYQKVMTYAKAMGFTMIEGDYEDPGQVELNWLFDTATATADRVIAYRQICRQVARELGVKASFMPKPATGKMGNGCHHNLSLWRGDENVLAEPGRREMHLTEIGKHALGGILTHAAASMAVMAPTVNSYKRYWDAGQFAPAQINWGMDNKTCTVRLSANGRLELKLPDAMVNPYLSHTVLLAAIEDGIKNQIDPGPPHQGSSYEGESRFTKLPLNLGEALDVFAADEVLRNAIGNETVELYLAYKRDEWARFCSHVTDWEFMMYAEDIP